MLKYKIDVEAELRTRGYNITRLQKEKLLPGNAIYNVKNGKNITLETLNRLCILLRCQPNDILECVVTDEEKIRFF